jgi:HNH endonuclease
MHRAILGLTRGQREVEVDHRNSNGLDNRRGNLRPASRLENARHTRYVGVQSLIVHFTTPEDYEAFQKLVGQQLTPKTRAI